MKYLSAAHRRILTVCRLAVLLARRVQSVPRPQTWGWLAGISRSRMVYLITMRLLLLVGLVVQVVLLFVAGYLIDLGISLMELWADLARRHLEITM
jgi:hypothetical protein